jgi:HEAT repeat protein
LKPRLFDLNLDVCKSTALGLARLPDPEVVGTLAEVLASINTPNELKSSVILALGWIGTQPAIDSLIAALEHRSIDLAPEIVTAISKTERERVYASQRLVAYLNEKELYKGHPAIVKQEIAAALGNLGNIDTVTDLVRLLKDPDDRVKLHVMTAISKLTSIVTVEMLPKKPEFPPDCGNQ